jgi:hypothetical protein
MLCGWANALGLLLCLLTIHTAEPHLPAPLPLMFGWLPVLAWAGIVQGFGLGKAPPQDI